MSISRYKVIQDLPSSFPVFPLPGTLLFPERKLPLNIFEPRYLKMVDDALSSHRIIGMIQPKTMSEDDYHPPLFEVGCLGRITAYEETEDGRYLIVLSGVSRFAIREEIEAAAPYRVVKPGFERFAGDLRALEAPEINVAALMPSLRRFIERQDISMNWDVLEKVRSDVLVDELAMLCPFPPDEKQLLLEAETHSDRFDTLLALLEFQSGDDQQDDRNVH